MISSSKSLSVITIISYLLCLTTNVQSQDVCICQPSTYQMQLNFALTCNDSNIYNADETNTNFTYPNGILESRCLINGRENNITDVIPLFVSTIQILELDINRNIINQEVLSDTYMSGDSITFTSIIASTDPNEIDPITNGTVIPYGIQALITGSNENGEAVVNSWVIIYDNTDCNTFPLLQANSNIGWVTFVSFYYLLIFI